MSLFLFLRIVVRCSLTHFSPRQWSPESATGLKCQRPFLHAGCASECLPGPIQTPGHRSSTSGWAVSSAISSAVGRRHEVSLMSSSLFWFLLAICASPGMCWMKKFIFSELYLWCSGGKITYANSVTCRCRSITRSHCFHADCF